MRQRGTFGVGTGMRGLWEGVSSFFEGVRLLRGNPSLWVLSLGPFLVTVLLFSVFSVVAWHNFDTWKDAFFSDREAWYWSWTGAELLVTLVFVLLLALLCGFTFVIVGSLLAAPFNDALSQKVETLILGTNAAGGGNLRTMLRDSLRGLGHAAIRLAILCSQIVLCAPLLFIPLLGHVAFTGAMALLSVRHLGWDGLDYCLSRRGLTFREKRAFLRIYRVQTVGYGAVSFAVLALPFVAIFALPVLAVGGTVLFCKIAAAGEG